MAPELSATATPQLTQALVGQRVSTAGAAEARQAGRNVRLAEQQRQEAEQRVRDAQRMKQEASERLRQAQEQESRAAQNLREASVQRQNAVQAAQSSLRGAIVNVLI